jgi:hypothetical protein
VPGQTPGSGQTWGRFVRKGPICCGAYTAGRPQSGSMAQVVLLTLVKFEFDYAWIKAAQGDSWALRQLDELWNDYKLSNVS